MIKCFCDRCGEEMKVKVPYMKVFFGSRDSGKELCEKCSDALYRFMGINTPGGGYEKLDSEVAEQCK